MTKMKTSDGKTFTLIKALTDEQKASGLLDVELKENEGLLMMYSKEAKWSVHTVGMAYSIDVIWLDSENRIADIASQVPPGRKKVAPNRPALNVVELLGGESKKADMRINDLVELEVI